MFNGLKIKARKEYYHGKLQLHINNTRNTSDMEDIS